MSRGKIFRILALGRFIFIFSLLNLVFTQCDKKNLSPDDAIVARVDGNPIRLKEFKYFYELDPKFGARLKGLEALREELNCLIDEILAYRLAKEKGVFRERNFSLLIKWEERQAMLRQLYREKIKESIPITEKELREEFLRSQKRIFLRHLFFRTAREAKTAYEELRRGSITFEELAGRTFQDSLLRYNGGALGWVGWGDVYWNLQTKAFELPIGVISEPLRSPWGYHILRVDSAITPALVTEAEFLRKKEMIKKRLYKKKERELVAHYLKSKMGEEGLGVKMKGKLFRELWNALEGSLEKPLEKNIGSRSFFTTERLHHLIQVLHEYLDKPLIVYKGGEISLGEFLNSLQEIPIANRPRITGEKSLKNDIGIWVRDEFLFREAVRQHLDRHHRVKEEVQEFIRHQSYSHFLSQVYDSVKVPEMVVQYFVQRDTAALKRYRELKSFQTLQEWRHYLAVKRLRLILRQTNPDIWINDPLLEDLSRQINWQSPLRMFWLRPPS